MTLTILTRNPIFSVLWWKHSIHFKTIFKEQGEILKNTTWGNINLNKMKKNKTTMWHKKRTKCRINKEVRHIRSVRSSSRLRAGTNHVCRILRPPCLMYREIFLDREKAKLPNVSLISSCQEWTFLSILSCVFCPLWLFCGVPLAPSWATGAKKGAGNVSLLSNLLCELLISHTLLSFPFPLSGPLA